MDPLNAIYESDLADMEKLTRAFDHITQLVLANFEREAELAQAMGDAEGKIRAQMRMSTMPHARSIYHSCYLSITRRRPWTDHDER